MEHKNKSAIILAVIVAIVSVLAGYTIYDLLLTPIDSTGVTLPAQQSSPRKDSIAAIDLELQGISMDELDSELADIEKELQ
jgi:hypothetical protein